MKEKPKIWTMGLCWRGFDNHPVKRKNQKRKEYKRIKGGGQK
jgi:hypothetical protein